MGVLLYVREVYICILIGQFCIWCSEVTCFIAVPVVDELCGILLVDICEAPPSFGISFLDGA